MSDLTTQIRVGADTAEANAKVDETTGKVVDLGEAGEQGAVGLKEAGGAVEQVGAALQVAAEQISPVEQAFQQLGITSTAQLERLAEEATQAFNVIRQDGQATATDIDAAFAKMAEAELAAAAAIGEVRAEAVAAALEQNAETEKQIATVQALRDQYVNTGSAIAQAFRTLGVESSASLQQAAAAARQAFNAIRDSGTATAADLNAAFRAVAEAELAAGAAAGEASGAQVRAALKAEAATAEQSAAVKELAGQYLASGNAASEAAAKAQEGAGLAGRALGALLGITIGAELIKQLAEVADEAKNIESRLRLATDSEQAFQVATEGVRQIAEKTGTSLEATAELYYKLSNAVQQTGGTQQDTLTVTRAVAEAIQLSGVSAQTAKNGIIQFAQGLAAGTLQGQDLRAVLEDIPTLGQAIAQGMGVNVAQLRALAEQGALTPQQILAALEKVAPQIAQKFEVVPQTVGRALTNLKTAVIETVGGVDKTTAASATLASAIDFVAKKIEAFGGDPAVREAFSAVGGAFKALLVDPVVVGGDTIALAFHAMQAAVDASLAGWAYALSKVTFGDASKQWAAAADSLAQSATEAFDKAKQNAIDWAKDNGTAIEDVQAALTEGGKAFYDFAANAQDAGAKAKTAAVNIEQTSTTYVEAAAKAKAAAAVFSGDLAPAVAKLVDGFNATKAAVGGAGQSISTFVDDAKNAKASTEQILAGLAALDAKGAISADQFREGLGKAVNEVALKDLPGLIQALQVDYAHAVDTSSVKTAALKQALQAATDEGFKRLGLESLNSLKTTADATSALFNQIRTQYPQATGLIADAYTKMAEAQLKLAAANGDASLAIAAVSLKAQAATDAERASLDQLLAKYPQLQQAATQTAQVQEEEAAKAQAAYDKLRASIATASDQDQLKNLRQQLTDAYTAGTVGAQEYQAAVLETKQRENDLLDSVRTTASAIGNVVTGASSYYHQLSDEAGKAFDDMSRNIIINGESISEYWSRLADVTATLTERQKQQSAQAQFYIDMLGKQDGATRANIDTAQYLASTMKYLDAQTLSQLTGSINSAKQALDDLDASASQTLGDLQNQLDQLEGNTLAIEERQNDAKRKQIQAQLAQAETAQDSKAIAQLGESLRLLDQIQSVQTKQAQEQAQQQKNAAAQQQQAPHAQGAQGYVVTFKDGSETRTATFNDQSSADAFLAMLKRQRGVSIGGATS